MKIASLSYGYPDKKNRVKFIFTHEQAKALLKLNVDIEVIDLNPDKMLYKNFSFEHFENVKVFRVFNYSIKKNYIRAVINLLRTVRLIKRGNYDMIIFSFINPKYLLLLVPLYPKYKGKLAVTAHGVGGMALWESKLKYNIKRYFLNKMEYIFAVSDFSNFLIRTIIKPVCYKKIIVNYNGINKDKFETVINKDKEELRKKLNITNRKVLLTVCDLIYRKGVDLLIEADCILLQKYRDFIHIIIGRGPEKSKLVELVNKKNLAKNVVFIDYIEEDELLAEYYKICDVYSMISRTTYKPLGLEGFGISYIEAEYLGKPVVGGNSGGVTTAVKHEFTGFLVDPDEDKIEEKIAEYIFRLFTDEKIYKKMSSNATMYVRNNFDWNKNARRIIETVKHNL